MSFAVTRLVRAARLPRAMKHRPQAKLVLLALANYCNDLGEHAWPAVPTIARESEISDRTVHKILATLRDHGLIDEQHPAGQHRPRTWRINLATIAALSDPQHVAGLTHERVTGNPSPNPPVTLGEGFPEGFDNPPDPQHVADLNPSSDRQVRNIERPGPQVLRPGPQNRASRSATCCGRSYRSLKGQEQERGADGDRGSRGASTPPTTAPIPGTGCVVPAAAAPQQSSSSKKNSVTPPKAKAPALFGAAPKNSQTHTRDDTARALAIAALEKLTPAGRAQLEQDACHTLDHLVLIPPGQRATLVRMRMLLELEDWRVRQAFGVLEPNDMSSNGSGAAACR